jgi:hypothetical protein
MASAVGLSTEPAIRGNVAFYRRSAKRSLSRWITHSGEALRWSRGWPRDRASELCDFGIQFARSVAFVDQTASFEIPPMPVSSVYRIVPGGRSAARAALESADAQLIS